MKTTETPSLVELAAERRTKPEDQLTADEQRLMKLERDILKMFMGGNIDQAMALLAEDAMVLAPGIEAVIGRENQRVIFKQLLATEGVELDWEPIDPFVGLSKDMAYVYGLVRWKMPEEQAKLGKYISIWVKKGGQWVNQVEMRNTIR